MASQIQTLPEEVIDLIAAGEVIDSMAAVVRELVENSLDAGASRINITLDPQLWSVKVTDNGRGMGLEDLKICVRPHSTSKIRHQKDLWHITSLGFRGEALHSIARVADLTVCSRTRDCLEPIGWKIVYREGKAQGESITAIAVGTIVTVSNLFAKIPVRRRGLPPASQQLKAIQRLIYQIALCHPKVTWQIKQSTNQWFSISPGVTARDILPQLLRKVNSSDLHYLKTEITTPNLNKQDSAQSSLDTLTHSFWSKDKASVKADREKQLSTYCVKSSIPTLPYRPVKSQIELVIGLPDRCHRHRSDWVKVSVNNRFVRSPELEQTIVDSMAQTLPRNRFPVCILQIHTCPSQVDWNRHPAKSEIYLHSLDSWQTEASKAITQALKLNTAHLPSAVNDRRISKMLRVAEESGKYQIDRQLDPLEQSICSSINRLQLKAVAQVNKTYIVAEHSSGVWLVEQHIAHERVLFEQLQEHWELKPLAMSITLEHLKPQQIEQLQKLEIEIEPFGENIWAIRNIPRILAERDDRADALIELSWGGDLRSAQVATACRSAIRNGTDLSLEQMQNLLNLWQATRNPRTCPHGRPIYLSLEESSLSRFFRRHWVIGKSHGI